MLNTVKSAFAGKAKFVKLFILFFIIGIKFSFAQWQPDMRLTSNPVGSYTSLNNAWCIAASGNIVHAVWEDYRDGNWEIYYKRSPFTGGVSWSADVRLTNNSALSNTPSVAVSGSDVYVVWDDERDGNSEIYYKRSTDGGVNWGSDTRLTSDPALSRHPSVTVSGSVVHVVWDDPRDGNQEIYYKYSPDRGVSWGSDTRLTNSTAASENPSVAISGSVVHVVWFDSRDGNQEIYYTRSTDGGIIWEADTRLTINSAISENPSVSVSGLVVHVVWDDSRDGNREIYYKRSTDGGVIWGADTRLTNSTDISENPSVSVSGLFVHVVWFDSRDGNREIYYKRSTDGGIIWGADTRLTNAPAASDNPSITISGSVVHVVWMDYRDGNWEVYYKRDPTGNPIGIINIGTEIPGEFSLGQNYPNPFNPVTKIRFAITSNMKDVTSNTKLMIFDLLGQEVVTLINEQLKPGIYEVDWNASALSSGVYFYKIETVGFTDMKKMVLVK